MKLKTILLSIVFIFTLASVFSVEMKETTRNIYENIVVEDVAINEDIKIRSSYNSVFNNIRVIIYYDYTKNIDDGDFETIYQEYMQKWVTNKNHRYYKYKTAHIVKFYKKYYVDGVYNTYEFFANLY